MAQTSPPPGVGRVCVRAAEPRDVSDIHRLIVALAEYEREPQSCTSTPADLRAALFPTDREPVAFALVAEVAAAEVSAARACDGDPAERGQDPVGTGGQSAYRVIGMAVWFLSFSTWTGRHGIWLEDLFVEPTHRGLGAGKTLLVELARICRDRGYPRLEWWVLDWNAPSIEFYRSLGAVAKDEWTTYRMDGAALASLADA